VNDWMAKCVNLEQLNDKMESENNLVGEKLKKELRDTKKDLDSIT
jgi:hypothetical protein